MEEYQSELKQAKAVVEDPRLSLTQLSRYPGSTVSARKRILMTSKYPGDYIPKHYDIARSIIVATFSANFEDYDLYFEEFQRHATRLRKEAVSFPPETDNYKKRYYSAGALEALVRMSSKITPILVRYVLHHNNKRESILVNEVKISSKADMLLSDQTGEQIGFLRFNFPQAKLKVKEAELAIEVLRTYAGEEKGLVFKAKDCLFINIYSGSIFTGQDNIQLDKLLLDSCKEIKKLWDTI
jgi:hypothetical protein